MRPNVRRLAAAALDRPGARWTLARVASRYARQVTGADVEVAYRGLWMHRLDGRWYADSARFEYDTDVFRRWAGTRRSGDRSFEELWFYSYRPREGDTVVHLGAGRGEDLLPLASSVGPRGRVVAIEAHPTSYRWLTTVARVNRLDNVLALNVAVAEDPGTIFIEDGEHWVQNQVSRSPSGTSLPIPALTLDELCERHAIEKLDLLMINIEGAESGALRGMEARIGAVRSVCVSCHDFRADRGDGEHFRTRDVVLEFLRRHGFRTTTRDDHPVDYIRDYVYGSRI